MGVKIEDDVDLPEIKRLGIKHGLKTGLARAQVKLPGNRKEMATGANAEWQLVGGRRDTVQVSSSLTFPWSVMYPGVHSTRAISECTSEMTRRIVDSISTTLEVAACFILFGGA